MSSPQPRLAARRRAAADSCPAAPGRAVTAVLPLALLASACAGGTGEEAAVEPVVRDSAGIRIVENPAASAERPAGLTVVAEPWVAIGVVDGPPEYQLYQVTGATRLPDGRIAVANAGTSELRVFDAEGRHLGSTGRAGAGPGEYRGLTLVGVLPGDSILLYDGRQSRFTVVSPEVEPVRSFQPGGPGAGLRVSPYGALGDGTFVVRGPFDVEGAGRTDGLRDPVAPLLRLDREGVPRDTLGRFPDRPMYVKFGEGSIHLIRVPFGSVTGVAVGPDRVEVGTADGFQIRGYAPDGRVTRIVRVSREPRPVTEADRAAAVERAVEQSSGAPAEIRARYEGVPMPDAMPAHGRLLADRAGRLWSEEYRAPGDTGAPWLVFDREGRLLGRVEMPEGLYPFQIGEDYVLGLGTDELDTPRVLLHPLRGGAIPRTAESSRLQRLTQ